MNEMLTASSSWRRQISILFPVPEFSPRKGGLCEGKPFSQEHLPPLCPSKLCQTMGLGPALCNTYKGGEGCFLFLFCFYNTTTNQSRPLMLMKQSRPPTECTEGHCRLNISRPSSPWGTRQLRTVVLGSLTAEKCTGPNLHRELFSFLGSRGQRTLPGSAHLP